MKQINETDLLRQKRLPGAEVSPVCRFAAAATNFLKAIAKVGHFIENRMHARRIFQS